MLELKLLLQASAAIIKLRRMSHLRRLRGLLCLSSLLASELVFGDCLPFEGARAHVGTSQCISGKVLRITRNDSGTTFLNFCDDYRVCPFQVVVFPRDLRQVGDVRHLEGKTVEIQGELKEYDGHAEIILSHLRQLKGEAARIPPVPKEFDVEKKGRYSAGKFSHPKSSTRTSRRKRQAAPIQTEDPASAASAED